MKSYEIKRMICQFEEISKNYFVWLRGIRAYSGAVIDRIQFEFEYQQIEITQISNLIWSQGQICEGDPYWKFQGIYPFLWQISHENGTGTYKNGHKNCLYGPFDFRNSYILRKFQIPNNISTPYILII